MKHIDYDKYQGKLRVQKWFWVPLLIALPITDILLATVLPDLRSWVGSLGQERLEAPYRYRFVQAASGSVTQALEQEMAFYQGRIRHNPEDGLDCSNWLGNHSTDTYAS